MDFKKRIIEELEMTDIQAGTLYKGYVQVAETLAKEYHKEQLILSRVSKRFTEKQMDDAYDKGYTDGINTANT
jgi:hypothetical protein